MFFYAQTKAALKSYFQQQGFSQDEVEKLLKEHKERKEKERADNLEREKKTALETANQRLVAAEFKVQAAKKGVQYVEIVIII